ncbi:MAG TPA: universal stress protein [Chthoniobacterales bacterium]|jgi:manganese transport protein
MFKKILVALDNSPTDRAMFSPICQLAKVHDSELLLLHVADGWAARNYNRFQLVESEEMKADRAYLEKVAEDLRRKGIEVQTHLALGDPAFGILKTAQESDCDLIAMTTHGHRLLKDLFYGSTITQVRHRAQVPVLLMNVPNETQ